MTATESATAAASGARATDHFIHDKSPYDAVRDTPAERALWTVGQNEREEKDAVVENAVQENGFGAGQMADCRKPPRTTPRRAGN